MKNTKKYIILFMYGLLFFPIVIFGLILESQLDNTAIYLKQLFMTVDGTNNSTNKIFFDGTNGNINSSGSIYIFNRLTTTGNLNFGNLNLNGNLIINPGAIADSTITTNEIIDGSVQSIDIADGTIQSVDILDGTIQSVDVLDSTISTNDFSNTTIGNIDLANSQTFNFYGINLNGNGNEGDINSLNNLVGYNDLFLKSNNGENQNIYYGGSNHIFYTAGNERMRIDGVGNLIIGSNNTLTTIGDGSLKNSLQVNGWILAEGNGSNTRGDNASRIGILNNGTECNAWWLSSNSDNTFAIHQGCAGDRLSIDLNGNVGFGESNLNSKLVVNGGMKVGNDTDTCNASKIGTLRYNSTSKVFEYCNGSTWFWEGSGMVVEIIPTFNQKNISVGYNHTCALKNDGTVKCWGLNNYGQIGDGTNTNRSSPVLVSGIVNATQIVARYDNTCALKNDGTVKCWGNNYYGQIGDLTNTNRSSPVLVSGLTNVTQISVGEQNTCVLINDGTMKCWGNNDFGQIGDGTNTNRYSPVLVSGITNATQISNGYLHTCALINDGTVKCWGYNSSFQIGDGTNTNRSSPVLVSGIVNATQISNGGGHTCVLINDGTVKCWGNNNYGQIGDGTNTNRFFPVLVSGLTNVTQISVGVNNTCALINDGTVKCWGRNDFGQLGDGTNTNRYSPVLVSGIVNATQISNGGGHTCVLINDGTIKCWGYNSSGQLGNGTTTNSNTPESIIGL